MFYIIYKITNQINGKFYIGSHKTNNLNDGYMGSGKYLKHAQKKYGIENFTKEILYVYDNATEMYAKEAEIVNEDFITENNTYNIKLGGYGGFDHLNNPNYQNPTHTTEHSIKMSNRRYEVYSKDIRSEWSKKGGLTSAKLKAGLHDPNKRGSFAGKTHSKETKKIMSVKAKDRMKDPTKNSQYNTMWITDGIVNAKINKLTPIPYGWKKGRVIKKCN